MISTTSACLRIFLAFITLYVFQAQGRWADESDAEIIREFFKEELTVHKDGTSTRICEFQDCIVKDRARRYASSFSHHYNSNFEKFSILEAKTIIGDQEYLLPLDKIEDKALASSARGFDEIHQILVPFLHVEVGAKICLKYKVDFLESPAPGSFSDSYHLGVALSGSGYYALWKKAHINIQSEIPLHFKVNDPYQRLTVKEQKEERLYKLSIDLEKSSMLQFIQEPQGGTLDPKHKCWVSIASFEDWKSFGEQPSKNYAAVIQEKLPAKLEVIWRPYPT